MTEPGVTTIDVQRDRNEAPVGIDWDAIRGGLVLLALCAIGFALKSPDALSAPQFWAEDGVIFFQQQQAETHPLVFSPYAGYLHFVPRITAWLASLGPLQWTPLFYSGTAWVLNSLCVAYFLFRVAPARLAAVAFVGVFLTPTSGEIFGTLTNVQWFSQMFLLAACFVPSRPRGAVWQWLLAAIVLVFSLTGPFSVLLAALHVGVLAVALIRPGTLPELDMPWRSSQRIAIAALWLGALVQIGFLATATEGVPSAYSFDLLLQSLGAWSQVHVLGQKILPTSLFLVLLAALTACLYLGAPRRGKLVVCLLFSLALLQIALASSKPNAMGMPLLAGDRYFFLLKVALWVAIIHLLGGLQSEWRKPLSTAVIGLFVMAVVANSQYLQRRPLEPKDWAGSVQRIAPGASATVPINPTPWSVTVTRDP